MNILMATRYFDDENGGIGVYSKNLLQSFLEKDHRIIPISTETKSRLGYFIYSSLDMLFSRRLPFHTINYGRYSEVDVYHALTPIESVYMPSDSLVVTFHDLMPMLHKEQATWYGGNPLTSNLASWWFKLCCKIAVKAEKIICNSQETKDNVVEHFDVESEKIEVVRMGISKKLKPLEDKQESENFRVGTLTYLDRRKRVDVLIRSFKELEDSNAELLIPSHGEDKQRLQEIAEGDDRIKFLGYLPENQKNEYLNSLDVFVMPSLLEGYGIPIVEALRCRTPAITLSDAMIPQDVQEQTTVVEKDQLTRALKNREFGENLEEGYNFALQHNWKQCADETEEIYQEVIE